MCKRPRAFPVPVKSLSNPRPRARILRYFQVLMKWERHELCRADRADTGFSRDAPAAFHGDRFEPLSGWSKGHSGVVSYVRSFRNSSPPARPYFRAFLVQEHSSPVA